MTENPKLLTFEQVKKLEEAGLIEPTEADWVKETKNVSYSDLVHEWGFDDEDGESHEPD